MNLLKKIAIPLAGALLACSGAGIASAHTTGASWNAPVGPYTVDVGYDPAAFMAGQYTRFDFLLWKGPANTGAPQDFSQVWIRIMRDDNNTLLATGIWKQPVGPTTLLFEFLQPGTYKLETSYRDKDGNDIAVASFPITVNGAASGGSSAATIAGAAGAAFLLGALGSLALLRRRR